jgi:hypothetical protein
VLSGVVEVEGAALIDPGDTLGRAERWHRDLAVVLRRYGFFGLDPDEGRGAVTSRLAIVNPSLDDPSLDRGIPRAIFLEPEGADLPGVDCRAEPAGKLLFAARRRMLRARETVYHPLLEHVSFRGEGIVPLWQTSEGRAVLAWWEHGGQRDLLVGLQVAEELVRYTQGDPARASFPGNRNLWGAGHEQPAYLYEGHVVAGHELEPWADRLGATLADLLARASGLPLIRPLPDDAPGAVLLTGDDDEAWLEKYDEQLQLIGDFPITYLLLPHTNHTAETLQRLPANVGFGVHVDALEQPDAYDEVCARQTAAVRDLLGKQPARAVRNHGHLNRNYWEHLPAWEAAGLTLGLNVRALDGTCPVGSYLPFRVRRPDGSWSEHLSLFSTFSDSMLFLQKWSEEKQIKVIRGLANRIERTHPGILVFNFHPQNVSSVPKVHRAVLGLALRKGWKAFGAEDLLGWLESLSGVRLMERGDQLVLTAPGPVRGLCLTWVGESREHVLPPWEGECTVPRQ